MSIWRVFAGRARPGHLGSVADPAKLIGQNLSFAHTNLPTLSELLLTEDFDLDDYDLVVDTNGSSRSFDPPSRAPVVNLNALQ